MLVKRRVGNSNPPAQQADVTPGAPSAASPATASAPPAPRIFDGATDLNFDLGHEGLSTSFTIDMKLRSYATPDGPVGPFDKKTPQMPFSAAGNVAAYLMQNGYSLLVKSAANESLVKATVGDPARLTRITLVSDVGGFIAYVNGEEVARSEQPAAIGRALRIGAGQLERFWSGEMEFFDVYLSAKVRTDFADRPGRFDKQGRVASLD